MSTEVVPRRTDETSTVVLDNVNALESLRMNLDARQWSAA